VYKLQQFIMRLEGEYNVHHGVSRLVKIVMTIMLVTHMVGCFWYLIGLTSSESGWVSRYGLMLSPKNVQYVASMYWAFSTLTTVGYGDISARTPQEQIYAMVMVCPYYFRCRCVCPLSIFLLMQLLAVTRCSLECHGMLT